MRESIQFVCHIQAIIKHKQNGHEFLGQYCSGVCIVQYSDLDQKKFPFSHFRNCESFEVRSMKTETLASREKRLPLLDAKFRPERCDSSSSSQMTILKHR